MSKNLYAILGVDPRADEAQIRSAYEGLIARVAEDDKLQRMALKEAWHTLGQAQRRSAYDLSLRAASRRAVGSPAAEPPRPGSPLLWLGVVVALAAGAAWAWRHQQHGKATAALGTPAVMNAPDAAGEAGETRLTAAAPAPVARTAPVAPAGVALGPEALFARVSGSVVRINVYGAGSGRIGQGSGVVMARDTVITNCHVARAGSRLKVMHESSVLDASVDVADQQHDLCRLSVPGLNAQPVAVGSADSLRVGQKVFAIGSPQGLDLTLSDGLVSSLRQGPDGTYIQTSAPISPGSSGGGLFNDEGVLVGIVTFQVTTGQNLNFAIPADWIGRMANTAPRGGTRVATAAGAREDEGPAAALLGRWQCFGPLTGRGLELVFERDGQLGGSMNGKPVAGRYLLQDKLLTLQSADVNQFKIEELSAERLVMTAGQGRRLACSR